MRESLTMKFEGDYGYRELHGKSTSCSRAYGIDQLVIEGNTPESLNGLLKLYFRNFETKA